MEKEKGRCLARLTNWDKTAERLAPCMTACRVIVCKNIPKGDSPLCENCLTRPVDGKYQTRILHGLLTEPIPAASRLYGSPWYWIQVAKHGETNKEWLAAAQASQAAAEEFCALSAAPWKVQRPGAKEVEMAKVKVAKASKLAAKPKVAATAGTLLKVFPMVTKIYEESDKDPVVLESDTCLIKKDKFGDMEVWIAEDGLVFDCDTTGDIGEPIGRYVNEEFQDL